MIVRHLVVYAVLSKSSTNLFQNADVFASTGGKLDSIAANYKNGGRTDKVDLNVKLLMK